MKAQIRNYSFQSHSDTDIILASYIKWGAKCLEKFNGMFAFAIWDRVEETLFIARDRLGIKPLYYYQKDNQLVFASEVRSLLESGLVPARLNQRVLPEYLRYYSINDPNTLVQDVYMLGAGEYGIWQDGKIGNRNLLGSLHLNILLILVLPMKRPVHILKIYFPSQLTIDWSAMSLWVHSSPEG